MDVNENMWNLAPLDNRRGLQELGGLSMCQLLGSGPKSVPAPPPRRAARHCLALMLLILLNFAIMTAIMAKLAVLAALLACLLHQPGGRGLASPTFRNHALPSIAALK